MEILINALVRATGWSIIHSLWQGAILYTLLLLLFLFNPKLSAKTRHNLSFMALAGIFLWFVQTFYAEFTKWLELGRSIEAFTLSGVALNYTGSVAQIPTSLLFDKAEQSIPLIVFIYSIGLVLQIVFLILGYLRVLQIRTKGLTELSPSLNERFSELSSKLGIERGIRFAQSSLVSVPLVIGYFKPMVLLPLSVLTQFTPQQLEAIIIHELSHIRRNDYLLNILKISIETILFFNPFVWLSGKLIDTERENACDDLVLNITGSPLSYAMTLLELEKLKQSKELFSMAITGKKYYLLNRIKRITNMKTSNMNLKIQLLAILVAVTGIFSLAFIPVKEETKEVKAAKKPTLTVVYNADLADKSDTTRKKIKIVIEDDKGNKKEYKSLAEMPADIRAEFVKENGKGFSPFTFSTDTTFFKAMKNFNVKFDTGYFKAMKSLKMDTALFNSTAMAKKFEKMNYAFSKLDSAFSKLDKKMFYINDSAYTINNKFKFADSLAFKTFSQDKWILKSKDLMNSIPKLSPEQVEKLKSQFDSAEWKSRIDVLQKQLNSPEYKQQMKDLQDNLKELQKQMQSPEFQKKLKEMTPEQIRKMNQEINKFGLMGYPNLTIAGLSSDKAYSAGRSTAASIIATNTDKAISIGTHRDGLGDTRVILRADRDSRPGLTITQPATTNSLTYGRKPADRATIRTTERSGRTIEAAKQSGSTQPKPKLDPQTIETLKKLLNSPDGVKKVQELLNKNTYTVSPDGKLLVDNGYIHKLPEGMISKDAIIAFFSKNELKKNFNFTPETDQQRVNRSLHNPENQELLQKIINQDNSVKKVVLNGTEAYSMPEGLIQKSDIYTYFNRTSFTEPASVNFTKTIYADAKTDTVKFSFMPDGTGMDNRSWMWVIGDKKFTYRELSDLISKKGHLEMVIPKPSIGFISANDEQALKKYGDDAKNGVFFIRSTKKS